MNTEETKNKLRIVVISSAENDENVATNDLFVADLNTGLDDKVVVQWHNYHDIGIRFEKGKIESFIVSTGEVLQSFDAVYFKSYFRHHEQATAIAESLEHHDVRFVGSELRHYIPAYKLSQLSRLARANFYIPKSIYLPMEHYSGRFDEITNELGLPFVFKAIDGSTGDDNYLVKNKDDLDRFVQKHAEQYFIAQEFIENDSDLRIVVMEGKSTLAIERRRIDDTTHLNNTSQGAVASLIDLSKFSDEVKQTAEAAALLMNRDIAGVDVMFEKGTGNPYILEVNASPQIASGAFTQEKRAMYIEYFKKLVGLDG